MIKYLKTFGKKLWEELDLFFDEQNRQIIIHSKKVKPMWYIPDLFFDAKIIYSKKVKPLWYIQEN